MEKMRQWTILAALGVVGVLAAGWFLLVSPQRAHASDLRAKAATAQQATAGLRSQVAQLKQQQKGEPAQQRRLMQIAAQIPDNPQLPTLIRELSAAAHASGVSLVSLSPSQPAAVASATTATGAVATTATAAAAAPAPLAQIPVGITVTGSYFNIESFFRSVEHLDRALMVTGFTLTPSSAPSDSGSGSAASSAPDAVDGQVQAVVYESPPVAATTTTPQTAAPSTQTQSSAPAQSGTAGN
jgi:Tfp pilus assembly protein PilO